MPYQDDTTQYYATLTVFCANESDYRNKKATKATLGLKQIHLSGNWSSGNGVEHIDESYEWSLDPNDPLIRDIRWNRHQTLDPLEDPSIVTDNGWASEFRVHDHQELRNWVVPALRDRGLEAPVIPGDDDADEDAADA